LTTTIVDPRELRNCLGRFATGVTVLTYQVDGDQRGVTVNAFSSISLDPPLIMVSVARTSRSAQHLGARPFCVNVLSAGQVDTAMHFAGGAADHAPGWNDGEWAPRLRGSHAWLECTPWRTYDGGDHLIFLGEVQALSFNDSDPLLFYSGNFHWHGDELDRSGRSRRLSAQQWATLEWGSAIEDEHSTGWA
jgi:flavin reductase (DIM6/NTAB) family NADH-FMN oxidoreductase RutF